jgi:hypothetical protein
MHIHSWNIYRRGENIYIMNFFTTVGEASGSVGCVYDLWAHKREGVERRQ